MLNIVKYSTKINKKILVVVMSLKKIITIRQNHIFCFLAEKIVTELVTSHSKLDIRLKGVWGQEEHRALQLLPGVMAAERKDGIGWKEESGGHWDGMSVISTVKPDVRTDRNRPTGGDCTVDIVDM